MLEAGVLLDAKGNPFHWHVPDARSVGYLPDSPDLWQVIWENRHDLSGFAHSHPGTGPTGPSHTDITTFAAVEQGLGRRLDWWIITDNYCLLCSWVGPNRLDYRCLDVQQEMSWHPELRWKSGYP